MKVKVIVTLKDGVPDPQGKAIQQTLNGMNFSEVKEVRQGNILILKLALPMKKKRELKLRKCVKNF